MANFNKVILLGNITRDPEVRYTPKGTAVTRITVAVNRRWRTETGELRDEATFVDVDAFGTQAEMLAKYLKKGNPILVEGRLRQHSWEDKQTNQKRTTLRVDLERFSFVGPVNKDVAVESIEDESAAPAAPPATNHVISPPTQNNSGDISQEDDDVPF